MSSTFAGIPRESCRTPTLRTALSERSRHESDAHTEWHQCTPGPGTLRPALWPEVQPPAATQLSSGRSERCPLGAHRGHRALGAAPSSTAEDRRRAPPWPDQPSPRAGHSAGRYPVTPKGQGQLRRLQGNTPATTWVTSRRQPQCGCGHNKVHLNERQQCRPYPKCGRHEWRPDKIAGTRQSGPRRTAPPRGGAPCIVPVLWGRH